MGRAQELLLILDEYWQAHSELHNIPIYYASTLAKKCMTVYQTYINMMNDKIRQQFAVKNPFIFQHISNLKGMEHFQDVGPCVVMASPGMLQSGLSRELFEMWCADKKNGVIIPGYCVEGTLAKHIMSEPESITSSNGLSLPLNMSVDYISFSAHSDFLQTSEFIDILLPPYVVLVHGDANEMSRLKQSLVQKYENKNIQVFSPKNGQTVQLQFRAEKMAKTLGKLANVPPKDGSVVSGILIEKDFTHHIVHPSDLNTYTQLSISSVAQRLTVPYSQNFENVKNQLSLMYDDIEETIHEEKPAIKICNALTIMYVSKESLLLEWNSDPVNDMVADSIISLLMQSQFIYKDKSKSITPDSKDLVSEDIKQKQETVDLSSQIINILEQQFEHIEHDKTANTVQFETDNSIVTIHLNDKVSNINITIYNYLE